MNLSEARIAEHDVHAGAPYLMGIDRYDNGSADNGSADDGGRDRRPHRDQPETPETPDRRACPGGEGPGPEEGPGRAELYTDMRDLPADTRSADTAGFGDSPDRDSVARHAEPDRGPRPATGDTPRTTEDGGWEWKGLRLGPDANRVADDALAARRSAEGRDSAGNYAGNGITPAMRRIEADLEHGSLVPDTEKFALKGPDRFKEKLAKAIEGRPDSSLSELSREIHDGIRYTFIFDSDHYTDSTKEVCTKLIEQRYELTRLANRWDGDEYKGINSRWVDAQSGQSFEIQFHTPESWDAKQKTHDTYEKLDNPETPVREVEQLRAYQRQVSSKIELPDRWKEITDYRKPES